ncbi:MAG: NAD(P)-binding domain-containing protein [Phycisphaerales bacterium]|nr:NAD(P)-binding domain-containing protein [Phycisphaerae bacterium]NNM25183.1 NAD(P)-binding domain-containing protein [Phycisphaerales bacterium]
MPAPPSDVAVIGGGPIGLELAVAFRQAGVSCVQFEAGAIGSTIAWWAPGTQFFSSPERLELAGVPLVTPDQAKATREQYLGYLRSVVRQFDLDVRTYERVVGIERTETGFRLRSVRSSHGVGGPEDNADATPRHAGPETRTETLTDTRRIVLAIGNLHRPRSLDGVPGVTLPHVSHYFAEPHRYFKRRVLIVGGKNSAVEAALRCYRVGADVTLSYRGEAFDPRRVKYWLRPEIEWLIEQGRIGWHPRTRPVRITPEAVTLAPVEAAEPITTVAADDVLLLTGYEQDPRLFEDLGVELMGDARAPRHERETMETPVPGVYVAGTAVGGSQRRTRVFIENSHVHVERIVRAITGRDPAFSCDAVYASLEES